MVSDQFGNCAQAVNAGIESFLGSTRPPHGRPMILTRSTGGTARGVEHVPVWRWPLEGV